ncbi:unnamed protein product [Hanseniaspora opuntiae]
MNSIDDINSKKPPLEVFSIEPYKARKDNSRVSVLDEYEILGYIAAGTYGKVYKAKRTNNPETGLNEELKPFNQITFQSEPKEDDVSKNDEILNEETNEKSKSNKQFNSPNESSSSLSLKTTKSNVQKDINIERSKNDKSKKPKKLLITEELENKLLMKDSSMDLENNKSPKTISQLLSSKRDEIDFFTKNHTNDETHT